MQVQATKIGYQVVPVNHSKSFTWCGGCETYQLTDANGESYIMQSYSQRIDPSLTETDLPNLGSRLNLPDGWSYAAVTLDADFVFAGMIASVVSDEYENAYTKMYRPDCEVCAPGPSPPPLSPAADDLSESKVMRIVVPAIVGVVAVLAVSSAIGAYFYCKWNGRAPSKAGARTEA